MTSHASLGNTGRKTGFWLRERAAPYWILRAADPASIRLIWQRAAAHKPLALVCHAPAVLRFAKGPDGSPLVAAKDVTGFTNAKVAGAGPTNVMPFLLQDVLPGQGARFFRQPPFEPHVVTNDRLVTCQNPASSASAALASPVGL